MATAQQPGNRLKQARQQRGWAQAELARRAGISRAAVSAIETDRLVPSVAAALALAAALETTVEALFAPAGATEEGGWAWPPVAQPCRYWQADVQGRLLRFPVEPGTSLAHDGCYRGGRFQMHGPLAEQTLVLASCDPAAGLLAGPLWQQAGVRLLVLPRSSKQGLQLLGDRLVHVAGLHLATADDDAGNAQAVAAMLGRGYRMLRVARWEEGIALGQALGIRSVSAALRARLRWVGRETGSAARQCLDELWPARRSFPRVARDHRGVAEAIRCGWADAGVCVRLVSDEAGLRFLPVRQEYYDLCFHQDQEHDPRVQALIRLLRARPFRQLLAELPGYRLAEHDDLITV